MRLVQLVVRFPLQSQLGRQEWQQVLELVQPDLILGYGDWGLAVRDYYPSPQPPLTQMDHDSYWWFIRSDFALPSTPGNLDGICARFSAIFPTKPSKFILCIAAVSRQRFDAMRSFTTGGICYSIQTIEMVKCNIDLAKFSYL